MHDISHLARQRTRKRFWLLISLFSILTVAAGGFAFVYLAGSNGWPTFVRGHKQIAVYFTPGDQTTTAIVTQLNAAKRTIHVQAYSFTSAPIAKALVDAERRNVDVIAILDKSNLSAHYSSADFLAHSGVSTYIDAKHAIAHNKVMIIDGETVVTGSFNFTKAAQENNAENLLILPDKQLAEKYDANWMKHLAHSALYSPQSQASVSGP